jgi:hypothetical protein
MLTPRRTSSQRQIEAAEGRGVEQWEGEVERAAAGQQPYLVAVPERADAAQRGQALLLVADQEEMEHAHAKVKAVEDDVAYNHYGNQPEPDKTHHDQAPFSFSPMRGR